MNLTPIQAKYYAYELTKRVSSDSVEKLASSLVDAKVIITPHQVEAALFAFKSPLMNGAILADEVGLGKTIEAGIVISQKWAERKRKVLIITPANLRKQWAGELADKFFLDSIILEGKSFRTEYEKEKKQNPFLQDDRVVITSFNFAAKHATSISNSDWDLVVIDEAHRLRNVYKKTNKTAQKIRDVLAGKRKILLTATPLQNSLLELYGLVSIIDEHTFGDLDSFKEQFAKPSEAGFAELKARLKSICIRTLRRQVEPYVPYTRRYAVVQEFESSDVEWRLYRSVTDFLNRPRLYSLPASQRQLMTLILQKLLASSTRAIEGTLLRLKQRLEAFLLLPNEGEAQEEEILESLAENYETTPELQEDWLDDDEGSEEKEEKPSWQKRNKLTALTPEIRDEIHAEIKELDFFLSLIEQITTNTKPHQLYDALRKGFARSEEISKEAPKKAIIFTESTRTQSFLFEILSKTEFAGKIVLFNGSNNDYHSQAIYKKWLETHKGTDRISGSKTADLRAALVDYFRSDDCQLMIATEAGAEGINLQFCNIVINYDLPWNPQRIEQRIGRCHRFGQKFDVVVVNFLDLKNDADKKVLTLLSEKFSLFEGVFGASDEVLGAIGSGIDFEKRISEIYRNLRHPDVIQKQFEALQNEFKSEIDEQLKITRRQLLENLDEEVLSKLQITNDQSNLFLQNYERWLWLLALQGLEKSAVFQKEGHQFRLTAQPGPGTQFNIGPYEISKNESEANFFRVGHPLAQWLISKAKQVPVGTRKLEFCLDQYDHQIGLLQPYKGKSGWLVAWHVKIEALEGIDIILVLAQTEEGEWLHEDFGKKLLLVPAREKGSISMPLEKQSIFRQQKSQIQEHYVAVNEKRNNRFFDEEIEKIERWGKDRKNSLEVEIKLLDVEIRNLKAEAKKLLTLEAKVNAQRKIKETERRRSEKRQNLYQAQDEIDSQMELILAETEAKLRQKISEEELFTIQWTLI